MEREYNLFYRLTQEDENATTELLCNLMRFDDYRNSILKHLGIRNAESISFKDIDTQYTIAKRKKRPDIIIENDHQKIYIENKVHVGTPLQLSQVNDYPRDLLQEKEKDTQLIFLVPKGYKHELRIKAAQIKYNPKLHISIVYWDTLLSGLKKDGLIVPSTIMEESVGYFMKILGTLPRIDFTEEEIRLMKNLRELRKESKPILKYEHLFWTVAEKISNKLRQRNKAVKNLVPKFDEDTLGCYIGDYVFIGYSFYLLDGDKKEYAASLAILDDDAVCGAKIKNYVKEHPDNSWLDQEWNWYFFKFDQDWETKENVAEELAKFCIQILETVIKPQK